MTPYEKHRAERDWFDAAREQEAADAARAESEWRLRDELESPDAEAARWSHLFKRMAYERPQVWHDERPAIDRRLHDWRAAIADGLEPDDQRDGAA